MARAPLRLARSSSTMKPSAISEPVDRRPEIARRLLMRRAPRPFAREHDLWRFRLVGSIVPDFDDVVARQEENLPSPARPILPLHLRPALLAGIAIVELAGPENAPTAARSHDGREQDPVHCRCREHDRPRSQIAGLSTDALNLRIGSSEFSN